MRKINGDGTIDFQEFERLTRYIEKEFYKINRNILRNIFEQYAVADEESKDLVLTPRRFDELCTAKLIFTKESYQRIFEKEMKESRLCPSYEYLLQHWSTTIKKKLKDVLYNIENQELLILLNRLSTFILTATEGQRKKIWLNYLILEKEANRLFVDTFLELNFFPSELTVLDQCLN